MAEARARVVVKNSIHYGLALYIVPEEKPNEFSGAVSIHFNYKPDPQGLFFLDFNGQIEYLILNGNELKAFKNKKVENFLFLPANKLKDNALNTLFIEFSCEYSEESMLCNKWKDTSGNTYIYTCLEPYGANTVFPLFDQPDLKADLSLVLVAPKKWLVLSG
jgi:aminopeptidase N